MSRRNFFEKTLDKPTLVCYNVMQIKAVTKTVEATSLQRVGGRCEPMRRSLLDQSLPSREPKALGQVDFHVMPRKSKGLVGVRKEA